MEDLGDQLSISQRLRDSLASGFHVDGLMEELGQTNLRSLKLTQKELLALCRQSVESTDALSLLARLFEDFETVNNYVSIGKSSAMSFDVPNRIQKAFTLQIWFRMGMNGEVTETLKADIFRIQNFLMLSIQDSKLIVKLANGEVSSCDSFIFEPNTEYHLVLVHEGPKKGFKLDLYINGEYVQSIQMDSEVAAPSKLIIELINNHSSCTCVDVSSVVLLKDVQPLEWMVLSCCLGPDYAGYYRDVNLADGLSYKSRHLFDLKLRELVLQNAINKTNSGIEEAKYEDFSRQDLFKLEQIHSAASKNEKLNIRRDSVLLHFHAKNVTYFNDRNLRFGSSEESITRGTVKLQQSLSIHSAFYSIGGISLVFKFIEAASSNEQLSISLGLMFDLISNDWRHLKEFEVKNGYDLLSTLLKTKKDLIKLNILDLALAFVGYNYNSPIDSILINPLAYRSLILDFGIWNLSSNNEAKETFKFLIFHFTVFFQESKYSPHNINIALRLRVIKRFVQAMKSYSFGIDMLPVVQNSLLILIKANPSPDVMKQISSYIVYALNKEMHSKEEPLQRRCGISALEALVSYICDPSLINSSLRSSMVASNNNPNMFYKKLAKTISVRWILVLLDDPNFRVCQLALTLLIKMLSVAGAKYYNNFMHHNGLDILTHLCRKWWNNAGVFVILFGGIFGISQINPLGIDLVQSFDEIATRGSRLTLVMPDFAFLIIDILRYGVQNAEKLTAALDLASALNAFGYCFGATSQSIPCLSALYINDFNFGKRFLLLIDELTNFHSEAITSQEVSSAKEVLKTKYAAMCIELLFKESSGYASFAEFADLFSKHPYELKVLQSHIWPKILEHLIEFESMIPELYSSQKWLRHNIFRFIEVLGDSFKKVRHDEKVVMNFFKLVGLVYRLNGTKSSSNIELARLRKLCGDCFVQVYLDASNSATILALSKEFIFHQEIYLHSSSLELGKLLLIAQQMSENCERHSETELQATIVNCLRTIMIYRQDEIMRRLSSDAWEDHVLLKKFFEDLLSSSDQDIIAVIEKGSISESLGKMGNFDVKGPELFQFTCHPLIADEKAILSFKEDIFKWRTTIYNTESVKYHRHIQDQDDNLAFYISLYSKLQQEASRLLYGTAEQSIRWVVDSIECDSRMRKRIVPEPTPVKHDAMEYETADIPDSSARPSINLTSQSQARSGSVSSIELADSFEMVEDPGDTEAIQEDKNRKVLRSLYVGDRIIGLWNVTQVFGLEFVESIFILGSTHLYIMEDYFYASNGEILSLNEVPISERDPYMQLLHGPKQQDLLLKRKSKITKGWELEKFTSVSRRKFLLRDVALEFFFTDGSSFLITCINEKVRDSIYSKLAYLATAKILDQDLSQALKLSNSSSAVTGSSAAKLFGFNFSQAFSNHYINSLETTKKWQRGEISNFYYLMIINTLSGRTFNDLTQYPVFPWVIADYTSEELDLSDPKSYRDMTKPMGAQNAIREATFIERYEAFSALNDPKAPPFHYGTHYSSAMIVSQYLIRLEPYVQSYLLLQGGRFDHADRLFHNIAKAWNSASKENTTDVRELIPEFFYLPEFLQNKNEYDFGTLQNGTSVEDVILPPWAKSDPKIFIEKNRQALESPYVSSHLHEWIDLIFGYKQTGQAAIDATNVYHHLSYNGAIDLDKVEDEMEKRAMTGIIHNFGQTPLQVFNRPHPARENLQICKFDIEDLPENFVDRYEPKSVFPVCSLDRSSKDNQWKGRPNIFSNEDNILIRNFEVIGSLFINGTIYEDLHSTSLTKLAPLGRKMYLTAATDGSIHAWKYNMTSAFSTVSENVTMGRRETLSHLSDTKHDSFELQAILRGHTSSVVEIKVAPAFSAALSLDQDGAVLLWDLVKLTLIREISTKSAEGAVKQIAISNETGDIALATSHGVTLFTVNGEIITTESKISESEIHSIEFAACNNVLRAQGEAVHREYWPQISTLILGTVGNVMILRLAIENGIWKASKLKILETENSNSVTAVRLQLISETTSAGMKISRCEIVAGDDRGKVYVWK